MENKNFDLKTLVDYFEAQNGIERDILLSIIEESIRKSARKSSVVTEDFRVIIDRSTLKLHTFDTFVVSDEENGPGFIQSRHASRKTGIEHKEGDVIEIEIDPSVLGRICARETMMLIKQKMKAVKNINAISTYKNRVGDIVHGIVSGIEKGNLIFTVGENTDMVIPRTERIKREKNKIGDSISGIIIGINEKQKHSPIVVSRTSSRFLEELLKNEVSEISNGTVDVISICRDPGNRAKISVKSNLNNVDPVGSVVGRRGSHINSISRELCGERIDVVKYSDNVVEFVKAALAPSKIDSITQNGEDVDVFVDSRQYPIVIGRNGNNIKLVSKLTNKKINVKKSFESMSFEEHKNMLIENLVDSLSISDADAEILIGCGFLTAEDICSVTEEEFMSSTGFDEIKGCGIYAAAETVANSGMIVL